MILLMKILYELWRQALESLRVQVELNKTEYLECKFCSLTHEADVEVILDTQILSKRDFSIWAP